MNIFIVYSMRDKTNLKKVKELILKLGHNPIVLDDIPPCGTVFDKLIKTAKECDKAIVLYSGFDLGGQYVKKITDFKPVRRTRENVLIELGLFVGMITIKNVLILLNNNIDRKTLPSDLAGVETKSLNVTSKTLEKNIKLFIGN